MAAYPVPEEGIAEAVAYVAERGYGRVTLQFPDDMLHFAPAVAERLQSELSACSSNAKVYVLADTTYNPLSVDEVAAQHVNADCVIHFGHASLTPVSRTPALCVLPHAPPIDAAECGRRLAGAIADEWARVVGDGGDDGGDDGRGSNEEAGVVQPWALVTYDQAHSWQLPEIRAAFEDHYSSSSGGPSATSPSQLPRAVFAGVAPTRLDPVGVRGLAAASGKGGGCCGGAGSDEQQRQQQAEAGCCGARAGACNSGGAGSTPGEEQHNEQHHEQQRAFAPPPLGGLVWEAPPGSGSSSSSSSTTSGGKGGGGGPQRPTIAVWIGDGDGGPALAHLQLTHSSARWLRLPTAPGEAPERGLAPGLDRLLKRRYFLVEKARGASIVGLLIGTLGAAGYLDALEALRALAAAAGKKTYTLLMGKPSPAKLANFPEVEVFVAVAEPQGLVLDSKEYLSPIVTPHEALLAFSEGGGPLDASDYRLDYGGLLAWHDAWLRRRGGGSNGGGGEDGDDGDSDGEDGEDGPASGGRALVAAGGLQLGGGAGGAGGRAAVVAARTAAEYLVTRRGYKGLETPATGAEVKAAERAVPGRSGRAAGYVDEPSKQGGGGE